MLNCWHCETGFKRFLNFCHKPKSRTGFHPIRKDEKMDSLENIVLRRKLPQLRGGHHNISAVRAISWDFSSNVIVPFYISVPTVRSVSHIF